MTVVTIHTRVKTPGRGLTPYCTRLGCDEDASHAVWERDGVIYDNYTHCCRRHLAWAKQQFEVPAIGTPAEHEAICSGSLLSIRLPDRNDA